MNKALITKSAVTDFCDHYSIKRPDKEGFLLLTLEDWYDLVKWLHQTYIANGLKVPEDIQFAADVEATDLNDDCLRVRVYANEWNGKQWF